MLPSCLACHAAALLPCCRLLWSPQEAKQLAEHWRVEAEHQRHSAASARAPETARSIKLLQDSKLAADEALLQKERELLQVGGGMAERAWGWQGSCAGARPTCQRGVLQKLGVCWRMLKCPPPARLVFEPRPEMPGATQPV